MAAQRVDSQLGRGRTLLSPALSQSLKQTGRAVVSWPTRLPAVAYRGFLALAYTTNALMALFTRHQHVFGRAASSRAAFACSRLVNR